MKQLLAVCVCVVVLLVVAAFRVEAQSHPCDQPAPETQTIRSGAPHKVAFCSAAADNIEALVVYIDGQAFDLLSVSALTAPSASGQVQYESPLFLQVFRGDHTLEAAVYNRDQVTQQLQLGPRSAPFAFAAVDPTPLPAAPVIKGIGR